MESKIAFSGRQIYSYFICFTVSTFVYLLLFQGPWGHCNKLDSTIRDFWWGYDHGVKKMHLLHWDKICRNWNKGGLGFKKFGLLNQSMLAKQFWRINQYPQSLLAKALKSKYFPRCSIQECSPKPHHSWHWRNIIKQDNIKLREARWLVARGADFPLHHPNWFRCAEQNM